MGLFFTLFYIFTAYISPQAVLGGLAAFHVELLIALLAVAFSIPALQEADLMVLPQTYGVIGLTASVVLSLIFSRWFGGVIPAVLDFLPTALVFFFVLLNFKKKSHLQWLIVVLLIAAFFNIFRGYAAQLSGDPLNPFILVMKNAAGENFFRIRGATFLNDPNDLAQFIVALIPCLFFFWSKGSTMRNFCFVILPTMVLLWGMYLTHSRGGMVALMLAAVVAGRRKFGLVPAVIAGVVVFAVLSVAGFSGGRDVSAESGTDRVETWSEGLLLIRSHPLFGVGFGRIGEYLQLTVHNSVVLCGAEVGLVGMLFWMLILVPSVRDANVGSKPTERELAAAAAAKEDESRGGPRGRGHPVPKEGRRVGFATGPPGQPAGMRFALPDAVLAREQGNAGPILPTGGEAARRGPAPILGTGLGDTEELTDAEIHRLSSLMLVSLTGLLTAAWLLPRTYTMSIFLFPGMASVVYGMARQRGIAPPPLQLGRATSYAAAACAFFLVAVYIAVRSMHLFGG